MSPAAGDAGADADPVARLAAWRAQGDDRVDPVRFRFLEALARRAGAHAGPARRLLDARLAALVAAYADRVAQVGRAASYGAAPDERPAGAPVRGDAMSCPPAAARGPLGDLVERLRAHAASMPGEALAPALTSAAEAPAELATLRVFRRTWTRLAAERRLAQSSQALPGNAGPLHSHHLVHRALTLMHGVAPEYLERFVGHVEALLWLEQTALARPAPGRDTPRERGERRGARRAG